MFDNGIAPILKLFLIFFSFVAVVDFLLTVFSQRLSLSTGALQNWLYNQLGQNGALDFVVALVYRFLSLRHRSFFMQMATFFNVGSFSNRQTFAILGGALLGSGLSVVWFLLPSYGVGFFCIGLGLILGLFRGEAKADFGVALLSFGAVLLALCFFGENMPSLSGQIFNIQFSRVFLFILVVFSALAFQTIFPLLALLSLMLFQNQIRLMELPIAFFLYGTISLLPFYRTFFGRQSRMSYGICSLIFWQALQLILGFGVLAYGFQYFDIDLSRFDSFLLAFQFVLLSSIGYFCSSIFALPLIVAFLVWKKNPEEKKKKDAQKIVLPVSREKVFSLHLSLILLRQEFLKMATLVHTLLKLGRDVDGADGDVAKKLQKYTSVLERVGGELKELCFSVGQQKAYRHQIQEILKTYKIVNHIELIVEDMVFFIRFLQQKDLSEDLERECRYWLNLQLKIYEVFFNALAVPGCEVLDPLEDMSSKAYEVIDRIVREIPVVQDTKYLSKALHRITDGNIALASNDSYFTPSSKS